MKSAMSGLLASALLALGCATTGDDASSGEPKAIDVSSWKALSVLEPDPTESHLQLMWATGAKCGKALPVDGDVLAAFVATPGAFKAGTFTFNAAEPTSFNVTFLHSKADASCQPVESGSTESQATAATLVVTRVGDTGVAGELTATLPDGTIYKGDFDTTACGSTGEMLETFQCSSG
jgi:hypothetical protein